MSQTPFRDLLDTRGVHEVCELRGRVGFMAYHGGALEEMTDVIAGIAAERSGASYYAVLQPDDLKWHIPSHKVSPAESPTLHEFVQHVHVVITIHGFGREGLWTTLLLGGQNRDLAGHIGVHLQGALPEYDVVDALDRIPRELRGLHAENPVNRPRQAGVQLELPPRVRGLGPFWTEFRTEHGDDAHPPHTEALIAALADAAASWPPS